MSETNLKEETIEILARHGKKPEDVKWVGTINGEIRIHPDMFWELADQVYDSGFGSNEVNRALVVVGDDWWLERWEYDGSEGWEFHTLPVLQPNYKLGKTIFCEEYEESWVELDNLEYLEWEHKRKENGSTISNNKAS